MVCINPILKILSSFYGNVNPEMNGYSFLHAGALYHGSKVSPNSVPSWVSPSPAPRVPMPAVSAQVLESTPPPHVMRGKRMSALGWKRCTSRVGGPAGIRGKDILFGDCSRHSRELALLNSQHFTSFIVKTGITILYMTRLLMKCETIFKELACNSHSINR